MFNRDASKHHILCRIERGTRWWRFHAATINSFGDMDSWNKKISEFPKNWPLTCHNWAKYWPRTKNNTTNREYSVSAICWSFPRSSTTLRLETPRGGRTNPPPLHRRRWRNIVYGRGLIQAWPSGQIILTDDVLGSKRGTVRYDETMMFCVLW